MKWLLSNKWFGIVALAFGGSTIYALPYMKYLYYDDMLVAFDMNNEQCGFLLSMYAIGCMILYIPGGIIADKFSTKKMMVGSLGLTFILGMIMAFTMNYTIALIVWFLFALSTSFVFWVALMKMLRLLGNSSNQGRTYGFYYMFNALVGIGANAVYLWLYNMQDNSRDAIFAVIVGMSAFCLIAAIIILLYREPKVDAATLEEEGKFRFRDLPAALGNLNLWGVAIIMFMLYAAYSCSSYFTPYFTSHLGIEASESAVIGFIRGYVLLMLAPVGGFFADKIFKSTLKFYVIGFIGLFLLFLSVLLIPASADGLTSAIAISFITSIFLFLMYGIMWSMLSEVKIPVRYSATAIGVASLAAYLPDLFLYTIFGNVLDNQGDEVGYNVIFITLAAFCLIAMVLCIWLFGRVKKMKGIEKQEAA